MQLAMIWSITSGCLCTTVVSFFDFYFLKLNTRWMRLSCCHHCEINFYIL